MSIDFSLDAEPRSDVGKGASRRLRRQGKVPAIIYGAKDEPQAVTFEHNKVLRSLDNEAFFSHIITLNVEGKSQKAILRDLQRHPAKPMILHMDFQRVSADQAIHVNVPLHFIGEEACIGVKQEGGSISHNITEVEVSCLPKDLPEFIEVDLAELHLNESIHMSDLNVPKGVTLVELSHGEEHDQPVASVHKIVAAAVEDEAPEPAEGEGDDSAAEEDS